MKHITHVVLKVNHYLDDLNENELSKLEQREDGKFEIIDVKLDNRKTKDLDKINEKASDNNSQMAENLKNDLINKKSNKFNKQNLINKMSDGIGKRFSMPDRRKGYIQKLVLEIIRYIYMLQVNTKMEKLEKYS